jgi:hypothetical protein
MEHRRTPLVQQGTTLGTPILPGSRTTIVVRSPAALFVRSALPGNGCQPRPLQRGGSHIKRLPELANELIGLPVDVLVALPSPAVVAARQATRAVPIVFLNAIDPVGKGFVTSLDHPGGNITGVTGAPATVFGKLIQYLAQLVPGCRASRSSRTLIRRPAPEAPRARRSSRSRPPRLHWGFS